MPASPHPHWYQFMLLTYFLFSSVRHPLFAHPTRHYDVRLRIAVPVPFAALLPCPSWAVASLLFLALSWTVSISRMVGRVRYWPEHGAVPGGRA
ncbi:hypothetical protein C8F04DRAFT_1069570 [Mycena alexandri]|uniref:Uncharacterized protein n=1 Tax=Mycena alexandri TaxID=1745969 RepID=A0AAD6TG91_9AGAR|nr:hypothetical protein C8F04DRAFT_1069570 [Mycena alexandri]